MTINKKNIIKKAILFIVFVAFILITANVYAAQDINWKEDTSLNLQQIDVELLKTFVKGKDVSSGTLQGMTLTDKYILCAQVTSDDENTSINIIDRNTYKLLNRIEDYCFKHANDMTYNPNTQEVYALTSSSRIAKFKINEQYEIEDLEYVSTTISYSGIAYNIDTDGFIGYYGGNIYILNNKFEILKIFSAPTNLIHQGIAYRNNYIYYCCYEGGKESKYQTIYNSKEKHSNLIYIYDMDGNLEKTLYIPRTVNNGELEGASFYDNAELLLAYNITLNGKKTVSFYKSDYLTLAKELSIKTVPTKMTYVQDYEKLDTRGGKLSVTYNDGSSAEIDIIESMVTDFDNTQIGGNELTVTYRGKSTTFNVIILPKKTWSNRTRAYFCAEITKSYGNGDCILLENYDENGDRVFGLIDTGRDIPTIDKDGKTSTVVVDYLKNHGVEKLEFLLITHTHGDHNGDTLSVMNNFEIDKIYMKEYDKTLFTGGGNSQTSYEDILKLAIEKDIKVIGTSYLSITSEDITPSRSEDFINNYVPMAKEENFEGFYYNSETDNNVKFSFGSSELKLFNWEMFDEDGSQYITGVTTDKRREKVAGENNNSLAVLLTQGTKKALFTGDMNNLDKNVETGRIGDEDRIKYDVGKIDLLKLGHHGYKNSNTIDYLNVLKPECAVITNDIGGAYTKTVNWLEENNVDYLYTTIDDYGILATITQNDVYLGLETTECFRNINGELYYIPAGSEYKDYKESAYKVKYQDNSIEVNNWSELKSIIEQNANEIANIDVESKLCTMNSLTIKINSNGDWTATDNINIKEKQKITIVSDDDVVILRDVNLKEKPFFNIYGELNIGKENMTGSITLNGNKENVDSSGNLIKVENGKLNLYNNVTLCGNMNKTTGRTKDGTIQYYTSFGSAIYCSNGTINMYGGKIVDNNTDVVLAHTLPKSIKYHYYYSAYGTGVYMTNNSIFNMFGGEISNNTAENHSEVTTNSNYTTSNNSNYVIGQGIKGVAIFASNNSKLNLAGGKIVGNKAKDYSETNIQTATNSTKETDVYAINKPIYGVGVYSDSSECTIKDEFILSDNTVEEYSRIYIGENTKVNGYASVNVRGIQAYFTNSSIEIDGLTVSQGHGTLDLTNENYGQIGNSGTDSISADVQSAGIAIYNSEFSIKKIEVRNCSQKYGGLYINTSKGTIEDSNFENNISNGSGGALFATGICNIKINNTSFRENSATYGGAIYIANAESYTELNNVKITNNSATEGSGGGITAYGDLVINGEETVISNNRAHTHGGGIIAKNIVIINAGTIENNIAENNAGGGIKVDGKLIIYGGTITNNFAETTGGGVDFTNGQLYIKSGTITGNTATTTGNDIYPEEMDYTDTTAPTVTILKIEEWTNKNVVVTIIAEEEETGIKEVKVNNNIISKLNKKYIYEISENGTYEVLVTDNFGNETRKQIVVENIDKIAPTVTGVEENSVYISEIIINAEDNVSGIKNTKLLKNNSEISYQLGTPISEPGEYEIEIEDNATNKTNIRFSIGRKVETIVVREQPTKTEYIEGENFDISGMIVVAIYNDNTSNEITDYIVTDGNNLPAGKESVTISYTENGITKTVEQEIRVLTKLRIDFRAYRELNENGKKYIGNIDPNTTLEEFTNSNNINTNGTIEIFKDYTRITNNEAIISTGMNIRISLNSQVFEYTITVKGDTNGDGKCNLSDLLQVNKHRLNKTLLEDEALLAGNVNNDGTVDLKDLLQINKFRLGKIDSL